MEERKMSKIEWFLMIVGFMCLILALGYKNIILGAVFVMCGFFVIGSIILRKHKENKCVDNEDEYYSSVHDEESDDEDEEYDESDDEESDKDKQ